ncbi:MAG: hypothetical protein GY711_31295 [bacterium]|nr:hypothetical protein [bacterium]
MNGVVTFDCGQQSFRLVQSNPAPGAIRVADWTDGTALVAQGANPRRIDLGFYPPSSTCSWNWWDQTTDGDLLIATNQSGQIIVGPAGSLVVDLGALRLSPSASVQPGET